MDMLNQMSFFNENQQYKITKPIRLIELFGGYGSQHFALEYLGADVQQWRLCEWAVKSIQAYKDSHCENDNIDYSKNMTKEQLIDFLANKGISANYNKPMTRAQVKRLGEDKLRTIYNNIKATHNLVNIQQVKGEDLEIVDIDKYEYIMTYSFPCQDLSLAGLGKGMNKGSGTRSGMLWEVERILKEIKYQNKNLPQVLLLENVPQVHGTKNKESFNEWCDFLKRLGYSNYWQDLNAKDFGIPQNRKRCFMLSILNNNGTLFQFPQPIKLESRLKDLLEKEVDEKYYLSDKIVEKLKPTGIEPKLEKVLSKESGIHTEQRIELGPDGLSNTLTTVQKDNYLIEPQETMFTETQKQMITKDGNIKRYLNSDKVDEFNIGDCADISFPNGYGKGDRVCKQCSPTLNTTSTQSSFIVKVSECEQVKVQQNIVEAEDNLKRQLCNKLIQDRLIEEGDVVRHSYTHNRLNNGEKNMGRIECKEKLSPTLDTRCDCLGVCVNDKDTIRVDASNCSAVYSNYRIRKLTPKECFRLMGVKDNDFDKIAQNQSNASLYHLAGDSIVVDVLMAIFKQML